MDDHVDYNNQYNKLYKTRLSTLRPLVKNDTKIPICKSILEINRHKEECVLIGILFVASDLKLTIFDKINPNDSKNKISANTYCSDEIKYYLEDETGKIEVKFQKEVGILSTGMILGLRGKYVDCEFKVDEVIYPERLPVRTNTNLSTKIAFISNCLVDEEKNLYTLRIILDYLKIKEINTLVLIGNYFKDNFKNFKNLIDSLDFNLILIPEYNDFECKTFPILPVHKKLFNTPIESYKNPSIFSLSGLTLCVTSSYILKDLLKYIPQGLSDIQTTPDTYRMHLKGDLEVNTEDKFSDPDNILKGLLTLYKVRHLGPNAPDTVPSAPYSGRDPFFIDKPIDFLFVRDDEFRSTKCQSSGLTAFTIPDFIKTQEIVILKEGNVTPVKLDIKLNN